MPATDRVFAPGSNAEIGAGTYLLTYEGGGVKLVWPDGRVEIVRDDERLIVNLPLGSATPKITLLPGRAKLEPVTNVA